MGLSLAVGAKLQRLGEVGLVIKAEIHEHVLESNLA
jgi:hypothetical protein